MQIRDRYIWCARGGFTLLELLVSLAVVATLLSVFLPAVQGVRSTMRRTRCESRLHQVGVAIQNFESRRREFPEKYWKPLLDDLGERALGEYGWGDEAGIHVPVLQCPADGWAVEGSGLSSFMACAGTNLWRLLAGANGLMRFDNQARRVSSITDGLSQSAMVSERLVDLRQHEWDWMSDNKLLSSGAPRFLWFTPAAFVTSGTEEWFLESCRVDRILPTPYTNTWTWSHLYDPHGYDHLMTPNSIGCINGNASGVVPHSGAAPATSLHPGGVNTLMCDGHVRFVSDSISQSVWSALGTINGGEEMAH